MAHMNSPLAEYFPPPDGVPDGNEMFWQLFAGEPLAQDGHITLNGEPGLGLEINWDLVNAYRMDGVKNSK